MSNAGKFRFFLRELKRPANIRIIFCVALFVYIWGIQNWETAAFGSKAWWFDNLGHFIAGIGLFYIFINLWATYSPGLYVTTHRLSVAIFGIAIAIIAEGMLWEGFEGLWDAYLRPNELWAIAQNSAFDTIIDIWVTTIGAVVGALTWTLGGIIYEKRYPNEAEKRKIEAMKEKARDFGKEILAMRREQKKQIFHELKTAVKKTIKQVQKIDPS